MKVRISNIQRFCLHDGPGIRTTVFLKGCNLRCPWCANPENIDYEFGEYIDKNKNEQNFFGQDVEIIDLYKEIIKDKEYYQINDGGITFSGGEPLLQIKKLEPLLEKLKSENINICMETALHVPIEFVKIASKYTNIFIIDIKILEEKECEKILKGNINNYIENLEYLSNHECSFIFRIPLVKEYTLKASNIELIISLLKQYKNNKVEIFKIHNLAESKYELLGKKMEKFKEIQDSEIEDVYKKIKNEGINVEIIKI